MRNREKPTAQFGLINYTQKQEKGITLIALIIMVLLLIILAMVSIKGLTGNESIIASSTKIANEYVLQQAKEYVEQLARSIILKDLLKGEETTLKSLATDMEKDENIKTAIPDNETGTIMVITKDNVMVEIYYDENTGELHIYPIGQDDKISKPKIRATYNKERSEIEAVASCEDGIGSIELIYKGNIKGQVEGKGAKEVTEKFKNIKEVGTYIVKVISSKGKVGYAYVQVNDKGIGIKVPTIEIISGIEGENNWYKGEVAIRINANETGGAKLKYRIVGQSNIEGNKIEEEKTAEGLIQEIIIRELGLTRIVAWVTNEDETEKTEYAYKNIKIDNIAPSLANIEVIEGREGKKVEGEIDKSWYVTDVKLRITAEDENSGVAGYEYTVKNTYTNNIVINKEILKGESKEISIKADGIYEIRVTTIDRAGNRSEVVTTKIYKDCTAPNEFMPSIAKETAKGFTIIAYTDDNLSGIDKYKYYVDDKVIYEGKNRQCQFEGEEDTAYGIKVEAYDKAGNIRNGMGTAANTKPEDSTPPIVIVTKGNVTTNSIQVFVTATDQGSGLAAEPEYTYYIKKSSEEEYKKVAENIKDTTYTYTGLEQATEYDIKVEVTDGAGNVGSGAIRIITTERVPDGNETGILEITEEIWENYKAKVTVSTTQTKYELQYKVVKSGQEENNTNWETVSNKGRTVEIGNLEHKDKIYARLYDGVNGGIAKTKEIIDETKPIVTIITKTEEIRNSITFKATDTKSGIVSYKVTKETEEPKTGWVEVEQTLNLAETTVSNLDYNTNYYVWVKDKAGNASKGTIKTIGEFTVTYNYSANGGTTSTATTKSVVVEQPVDLSIKATKTGWTFVGWNTDQNATTGLTSLVMPANDITLYAIYSKTLTVTYHTYNNQTTTSTVELKNKETSKAVTLPSIASVTNGGVTYTPRGWGTGTTANGAVTAVGTKINVTTNLNYYASYQSTVSATFYYNNNKTSGGLTITTATASGIRYMNYTGTKIESNLSIPTVVTSSVGKYNSAYKGVANAINTMTITTPTTANTTYYTTYSTQVRIYYQTSEAVATNMTRYRNEYFTSATAITTKLGTSNTATTDFAFSSSVSGYSLYGFATAVNTTTRNYQTVANLRDSNTTTAYAILYKSESVTATFYYNNNKTSGDFTSANTTASATRIKYLKSVSNTTAGTTIIQGTMTVPTVVSSSVGKYNSAYRGVASSLGTMVTASVSTNYTTYYTVYSSTVNIYYPQSTETVKSRTLCRNEWFASTGAMSTVLGTNNTALYTTTNIHAGFIPDGFSVDCYNLVPDRYNSDGLSEAGLVQRQDRNFYAVVLTGPCGGRYLRKNETRSEYLPTHCGRCDYYMFNEKDPQFAYLECETCGDWEKKVSCCRSCYQEVLDILERESQTKTCTKQLILKCKY